MKHKLLVTSDLHLSNKNSKFKTDSRGVSFLLESQHNFCQWVAALLEESADAFLFLGDFTDYATLDPVTAYYSNMCLKAFTKVPKPSLLLEGNHCVADKKNAFTVLTAADQLLESDKVKLSTQFEKIAFRQLPNVRFYSFPYISDYSELEEKVQEANENLCAEFFNIMLFHFPVTGARLDNGTSSRHGAALNKSLTNNFDLILGGDFHTFQEIYEDAYYVGAPFDLKFGEHYDRSVLMVEIDTETKSYHIEHIQNPYQIPIIKTDAENLDEIPDNAVVHIETSGDSNINTSKLKKRSHRVTVSKRKEIVSIDQTAGKIVKDTSLKNDKELLKSVLEQNQVPDNLRERAIEIFSEIQMEAERDGR